MKTLKEELKDKRERRLRPLTIIVTILFWTVVSLFIFSTKCQAQSLSERINNYEYVADNGQILYGLEAYYRYADDRNIGWKVFASGMVGATVYGFVAPQNSCQLSWWERRKQKRQFKKRRRR